MTKVLVLAGGSSDEREVSLRSGAAVTAALEAAGYEVAQYDPASAHDNLAEIAASCDAAFPALHGIGGEDGTIQAKLEQLGIPYVGSNVVSSELCFEKWNYRILLQSHNLPVADGALVRRETFYDSPLIKQPYVLKPPTGGSSIDTILAHQPASVQTETISEVFDRHQEMLLEELVAGQKLPSALSATKPCLSSRLSHQKTACLTTKTNITAKAKSCAHRNTYRNLLSSKLQIWLYAYTNFAAAEI